MATNKAKFSIDGNPSSSLGYDATTSQVLNLLLEDAVDVQRVTYYVYDPAVASSPLASKDAPLLTFSGSGLKSESPAVPTNEVLISAPGTSGYSYILRAVAVTSTGNHVFERIVAIRKGGLRSVVPFETTQYSARGWADAWAEYVLAIGGSIIAGGTVADNTMRWSGTAWVETAVLKVGSVVAVSSAILHGAIPAITGDYRVKQNYEVRGRNNANLEDGLIWNWGVEAADRLIFGDDSWIPQVHLRAQTSFTVGIGGGTQLVVTDTDANFQNNNLLTTGFAALSGAGSYVAIGTSPAVSGQLRAGSAWSVVGKTAVAADQIVLSWGISAADTIALGNFGGAVAKIEALATTQIDLYVASALQLRLTNTTIDAQNNGVVTTGHVASTGGTGFAVADFGAVRLSRSSQGGVWVRNNAGTNNVLLIAIETSDAIFIGGAGTVAGVSAPGSIIANAVTQHEWRIADATKLTLSATLADFQNVNVTTTGTWSVGASPATTGLVRFAAGAGLYWKYNAGNVRGIAVSGGNVLIGDVGTESPDAVVLYANTYSNIVINNVGKLQVTGTGIDFNFDAAANFILKGASASMIGFHMASAVRNLDLFGDGTADMNGGDRTIAIRECATMPSGASSTGNTGQLVNHAGELKWLAPNGNVTSLGGL